MLGSNSFGHQLGPLLIQRLLGDDSSRLVLQNVRGKEQRRGPCLFGVGTILADARPRDAVWGSGLSHSPPAPGPWGGHTSSNETSRLLANGGCIRVHIEQRSFASQNFDFCEVGSAHCCCFISNSQKSVGLGNTLRPSKSACSKTQTSVRIRRSVTSVQTTVRVSGRVVPLSTSERNSIKHR